MSMLEPVLPGISLFRDTCNVYVLQWEDGTNCIFDFASGAVLDAIQLENFPAPELVIHTDYRRDRTYGYASHPGMKIAMSEQDATSAMRAEEIWQELQVDHCYGQYERFWLPRHNIPVSQKLHDGELVVWKKPYIYAQHLGGHTPGAMGYLIVDQGRRYLIGGDILQWDGTLHSIFELQRAYNFMEGLHAIRRAAGWLASGDIEAVLPSHGEPIIGRENVVAAASKLVERIADFWERWRLVWPDQPQGGLLDFAPVPAWCAQSPAARDPYITTQNQSRPVLPHLRNAFNLIQYAIVDDDGNAVFFDTGVNYPEGYEAILEQAGITNVEIAFITHHHDDHVMGYHWLKERFGTKLATHEAMVDVLENPTAYALNCTHDRSLKVDYAFAEGEIFNWRDYEIATHWFPSQTEYHAVFFAKVDGVMVCFSGDSIYWEPGAERIRPTDPDWRNRFDINRGYLTCAPLLKKYQPRILAASHVHPWPISEEACNAFEENAKEFHNSLRALVGRKHPTLGIDPLFISTYPYRAQAAERIAVEVRIDNPCDYSVLVKLQVCLPEGIETEQAEIQVELSPLENRRIPIILTCANLDALPSRSLWAVHVWFDGEDLGEFAEGMIGATQSL